MRTHTSAAEQRRGILCCLPDHVKHRQKHRQIPALFRERHRADFAGYDG